MTESARSTAVIWLVAAALAVAAGVKLLGGGGAAPPPVRVDAPAEGRAASERTRGADVFVHVAGAVRRPGLLRLPSGARVATALRRVGGPTRRADLTLVNLAARVQDGQQIVVPVAGGAAAPGSGATAAAGSTPGAAGSTPGAAGSPPGAAGSIPGAKIPLSTATAEQLDEIDGIGPTLAERIIEYRDANGGVRSLEELAEVDGIGEKRLATLREALQP